MTGCYVFFYRSGSQYHLNSGMGVQLLKYLGLWKRFATCFLLALFFWSNVFFWLLLKSLFCGFSRACNELCFFAHCILLVSISVSFTTGPEDLIHMHHMKNKPTALLTLFKVLCSLHTPHIN